MAEPYWYKRDQWVLVGLILLSIAAGLLALSIGKVEGAVFWAYRLPRVLMAFGAGAVLAGAGVVFQSTLSNELASPYTLGVSSAASLGAVLMIVLGLSDYQGAGAIVAALISTWGLLKLAARWRLMDPGQLVLLGTAQNTALISLVLFLQFQLDRADVLQWMHWVVGSIQNISWVPTMIFAGLATLLATLFIIKGKTFDILSLGDTWAKSKGVDVAKERSRSLLGVSIAVAMVVAYVGPIGFIGVLVPQALRAWRGPNHRGLGLQSLLLGGVLLTLADLLARRLMYPLEMPAGILLALLGSIVFGWILSRRLR